MRARSYTNGLREIDAREVPKALALLFGGAGVAISALFLYMSLYLVVYEVFYEAGMLNGGSFEFVELMKFAFNVPFIALIGMLGAKAATLLFDGQLRLWRWAFYATGVYTFGWGVWLNLASHGVFGL